VNKPDISQTSSMVDVSQSVDAHTPLLRVYTFGTSRLDWQVPPFTTEDMWKSRTSARTLFKLLLCAPGRQASRSQLAGILWPETDEDKARESLRSASKVLRKVLQTARGEELLEQRNQSAILKLAEQSRLWVDADAFEDLVSQAGQATAPDEALALWQQAKALLRGEFLADDQGSEWMRHRWIKMRQQALRMARSRMVRHLADLYLQRGQVSLAEEVLQQHMLRFPTDQDALYLLLALLEQQGCLEEARQLYERAKRTLEALGK
jgi:DNA-binding SARP family transcriptional activator